MGRKKMTDPKEYLYYDKKNDICWLMLPGTALLSKDNTGLSEDSIDIIRETLNTWNDEDINKFILDDEPLGDFLISLNRGETEDDYSETSLALAIDAYYPPNEEEYYHEHPEWYVFNKGELSSGADIKGVLSYTPFSYEEKGLYEIDYAVVNKHCRGKGLGSAMISSFRNNTDFFTNYRECNAITTSVRDDNFPSKKAFLKNKFKIVRPAGMGKYSSAYNVLRCDLRNPSEDKEM